MFSFHSSVSRRRKVFGSRKMSGVVNKVLAWMSNLGSERASNFICAVGRLPNFKSFLQKEPIRPQKNQLFFWSEKLFLLCAQVRWKKRSGTPHMLRDIGVSRKNFRRSHDILHRRKIIGAGKLSERLRWKHIAISRMLFQNQFLSTPGKNLRNGNRCKSNQNGESFA